MGPRLQQCLVGLPADVFQQNPLFALDLLHFPRDAGFVEYQISPTWGGVGDVKREADSYRFSRSYISARP